MGGVCFFHVLAVHSAVHRNGSFEKAVRHPPGEPSRKKRKEDETENEEHIVRTLVREAVTRESALAQENTKGHEATHRQLKSTSRNIEEYLRGLSARLEIHAESLKPIKPPDKFPGRRPNKQSNGRNLSRPLVKNCEMRIEAMPSTREGNSRFEASNLALEHNFQSHLLNLQRPSVIVSPRHNNRKGAASLPPILPQQRHHTVYTEVQHLPQSNRAPSGHFYGPPSWEMDCSESAPRLPLQATNVQLQTRLWYQKHVSNQSLEYKADLYHSSIFNCERIFPGEQGPAFFASPLQYAPNEALGRSLTINNPQVSYHMGDYHYTNDSWSDPMRHSRPPLHLPGPSNYPLLRGGQLPIPSHQQVTNPCFTSESQATFFQGFNTQHTPPYTLYSFQAREAAKLARRPQESQTSLAVNMLSH